MTIAIGGTPTDAGAALGAVSTFNWSHAVGSGANRLLAVCVGSNDASDTDRTVSSITLGAATLSTATANANDADNVSAFIRYLVAPASGAGTVTVTMGGTCTYITAFAVDLTGVDQDFPLDSTDGASLTNNASPSASIAPNVAHCFVLGVKATEHTGTYSVNQTDLRPQLNISTGANIYVAYLADGSVGTTSFAWSGGAGTHDHAIAIAAFAPAADTGLPPGLGPVIPLEHMMFLPIF